MSDDWRIAMGLEPEESEEETTEEPAQDDAPQQSLFPEGLATTSRRECDKQDYDRLVNLAAQVNWDKSWVMEQLKLRGVELTPFTLANFNTTIFDAIASKIDTKREELKAKVLGPDKIEELFLYAKSRDKESLLTTRLNEHGVKWMPNYNEENDWQVDGLNAYNFYIIMWEMKEASGPVPKPARAPRGKKEKTEAVTESSMPMESDASPATLAEPRSESSEPETSSTLSTAPLTESLKTDEPVDLLEATKASLAKLQPPTPQMTAEEFNNGRQIVDAETGEVLNPGACFELMGIVFNPTFQLKTLDDAEWFVGKVRIAQRKIEDIAFQAISRIAGIARAIEGLSHHFSYELRQVTEPELKRYKKGDKIGQLAEKNLKLEEGTVFYRTTGGLRQADKREWQEHILRVVAEVKAGLRPESDLEKFCIIESKVTYDYNKLKAKIKDLTPQELAEYPGWATTPKNELGLLQIGGLNEKGKQAPWTLTNIKKRLKERLTTVVIKGEPFEDESEGGESDNAHS